MKLHEYYLNSFMIFTAFTLYLSELGINYNSGYYSGSKNKRYYIYYTETI